MNTTNTKYTSGFPRNSHPISRFLDPIDWIVFGNVSFSNQDSHTHDNGSRIRRFSGLIKSLSRFCGVKTQHLVFYQNNETAPDTNFHHIHFLLGRKRLEHFTPEAICQFLEQMSDEFGFGPCVYSPFDPQRDGVGYVTKKVHRFKDGKCEVIPLDYYPSTGLVKLWKEKGLK